MIIKENVYPFPGIKQVPGIKQAKFSGINNFRKDQDACRSSSSIRLFRLFSLLSIQVGK
jgi:hypothetical protein